MKNLLKVVTVILLTLSLMIGTAALACEDYYDYYWCDTVVATGGSSYIRTSPSLYGSIVGDIPMGRSAVYLGYSDMDSRGVRWDYVYYNGTEGWVSSMYTSLY